MPLGADDSRHRFERTRSLTYESLQESDDANAPRLAASRLEAAIRQPVLDVEDPF